jgi:hypothetical protein
MAPNILNKGQEMGCYSKDNPKRKSEEETAEKKNSHHQNLDHPLGPIYPQEYKHNQMEVRQTQIVLHLVRLLNVHFLHRLVVNHPMFLWALLEGTESRRRHRIETEILS